MKKLFVEEVATWRCEKCERTARWDEVRRKEREGRWTDWTGGRERMAAPITELLKCLRAILSPRCKMETPPSHPLPPRGQCFRSCSPPSALHPRTPRLILFLRPMFHASFVFSTLVSLATLFPCQMDRIISIPWPAFNNIACEVFQRILRLGFIAFSSILSCDCRIGFINLINAS